MQLSLSGLLITAAVLADVSVTSAQELIICMIRKTLFFGLKCPKKILSNFKNKITFSDEPETHMSKLPPKKRKSDQTMYSEVFFKIKLFYFWIL